MTVTDALKAAHDLVRRSVVRKRKAAHLTEGGLASQFAEALDVMDAQKAAGVPFDERVKGLEGVLRASWPQTREWHYVCERCEDTGWWFRICTPELSCGRPFRLPGASGDDYTGRGRCSPGHTYVQPCPTCEKGESRRRGLMHQPRPANPEDFTQAGKSKPTRVGR
jgi:hypothetical protein